MTAETDPTMIREEADRQVMALTSRQMTATLLAAVLMTGLMAGIAYVAGRSINSGPEEPAEAAPVPAVTQPVPNPAPAPSAGAVASAVQPAPAAAALNAPAVLVTPGRAEKYLQVCAVDRGVGEIFVDVLARKGFVVRLAEGPDAKTFRVLVGPLEGADIAKTKAALEKVGFAPFVRLY